MSRPVPARTDATTLCTATVRSTGRGKSDSRPVSMRATSSSSAISRVSRSASTFTVSSIIFFWASLSLSHFDSNVDTKPLTPVSGERSSWATVATRSERSRSRRSRARAERNETATCRTGRCGASRTMRAVTRSSVPSERYHACSLRRRRVARPA
jgi:hypothetical protein